MSADLLTRLCAPHAKVIPPSQGGRSAPTISVVVPCYNYGRYLGACVKSILAQEGVRVGVLIIDDASTDGSGEVAAELATRHDCVRTVRHSRNTGHIRTYNEGLAQVDGDYTVVLSADDLLPPGALQRATDLLEAHPSVGFAYGHPREFADGEVPAGHAALRSWSVWRGQDWLRLRFRRGFNCILTPEVVVRTSVQREIGPFREDLPHSGDMELWLRAASIADVGRVNGPDQAFRRLHATNMSRTAYGTVLADLRGRWAAYDAFLSGFGAGTEGTDDLRAAARRRLAYDALAHVCARLPAPLDEAALIDFARTMWPALDELRPWRELAARRAGRRTTSCVYAVLRDITSKGQWRQWRRSGI